MVAVVKVEMPYVQSFVDRHGKARYYLRKPGHKRVPLPAPGSRGFAKAYEDALNAQSERLTNDRSLSALITRYYESAAFKNLADSTKTTYRNVLERLRKEHGSKLMRDLDRPSVIRLIDERAEAPAAANFIRRMLKILVGLALDLEWITHDPTAKVKKVRYHSDGFHTWTEVEIERFEARHAIGTMPRLAFALMLYTGVRRSDVVRLGRGHVRDGRISVQPRKTRDPVTVPIHPELQEVIDGTALRHINFVTSSLDKPYTPESFGNRMREWCDEAGLPECSSHGLRKACATRLADAGATTHEIAAVTGHKSLADIEVYTRKANQRRLADRSIAKLGRRGGEA